MNFVTDPHALLWWFTDSPRISKKASEIFKACEKGENLIFIPSIVIAESLSIFDKKRITFNFKKRQNPSRTCYKGIDKSSVVNRLLRGDMKIAEVME